MQPSSTPARSKFHPSDSAFTEISGRLNVVSRSQQNFSNLKKIAAHEVVSGRFHSTKYLSSRRHSVASKQSSPKVERKATFLRDGRLAMDKKVSDSRKSLFQAAVADTTENVLKTDSTPKLTRRKAPTTVCFGSSMTKSTCNSKGLLLQHRSTNGDVNFGSHPLKKAPCFSQRLTKSVSKEHSGKSQKDSLKSAAYWLEQVKLAESVQKHEISLEFFRLAVECDAEPLQMLREALLAYRKRHTLSSEGITQVLSSYGVKEDGEKLPKESPFYYKKEVLDSVLVSQHVSPSDVSASEPTSPSYGKNTKDNPVVVTAEDQQEKMKLVQTQDIFSDISERTPNVAEAEGDNIVPEDEDIMASAQMLPSKLSHSSMEEDEQVSEECRECKPSELPKVGVGKRSNGDANAPHGRPKPESCVSHPAASIPKVERTDLGEKILRKQAVKKEYGKVR